MKAEIGRKNFAGVGNRGALWTRPKKATFVVFSRSEPKISGNVAYDHRNIVLKRYGHRNTCCRHTAIQKSIFRQNVVFVDQNVANILTKNGFLMAHMSATSACMTTSL